MSNKIKLFKQKAKTFEVGAYRFVFNINEKNIRKGKVDGTYLKISERNGQWSLTLDGNAHVFGYLLTAAQKEMLDQLRDYAMLIHQLSLMVTTDQTLTHEAWRVLYDWQERQMTKGAENAKSVTEEQEMASQALMEDIASEVGMSEKELKAKREEDKAILRELLNEDKEGEE